MGLAKSAACAPLARVASAPSSSARARPRSVADAPPPRTPCLRLRPPRLCLRRPAGAGHVRRCRNRHGLPRLQLQGGRSQCATPESDSTVPLQATGPPGHPPTHPATHGVWQVKDDSAAHQMDVVFDSLLDKAAEAEGCAGASPVETRPKRRIGRGRPVPGASRGWCGSERRLQSTSWPQADPASDPACSRPGAARLVCKSEWDYKVITNADPTLNPSPNA